VLAGRQLANFNPVSARARSIADQFLNAPTIIAAVKRQIDSCGKQGERHRQPLLQVVPPQAGAPT
jgi:hypothetical protein